MKATLSALSAALLCATAQAQNPPQDPPQNPGQDERVPPIQEEGDVYVLNFSEAPDERLTLEQFVKLCQEATGLNFTYNPDTQQRLEQGNVVMFGPKRVPKGDFYQFFQIQMFINDFVCVEVGPPHISVILIQSLQAGQRGGQNIKQKAHYVLPEELEDYADQPATLVTTVLSLPNTDVRQLSTSLRGLLTDTNTQTLLAAGEHSVILQGFGSYIASLARLLQIVDEESAIVDDIAPVFDVVPLEYAAAEDIADLLEQLLEAQSQSPRAGQRRQGGDGQGVSGSLIGDEIEPKILVYARTNSLLVMAMPDEMPRIKDLVARLDVDVIEPERNFHIYKVENAKADELAEVLDEFLSDAERLTGTTQGGTGGRAQGGGGGGGGSTARTSNEVVVVPDENSNSILVAANKTRYEEVLELIRQLDKRQDQVLIETALIELTGNDLLDLGVEWAIVDDEEGFGATNFGLSELTDTTGDGLPDLRVPIIGNGFTAGILDAGDVNLPFLIRATKSSDSANVLNIPSVLVNNNGYAKVVTLDQQPTTTITTTGASNQTQENFRAYEDAGITLEISPSISASKYLRLDISLIVSNFSGSFSGDAAIPPPRITREIQTTVNVPDGDTMVIGGVIADIHRDDRQGVPWFADLPIIGALFRRDQTSKNKTTLYFFVTPHILRDQDFADLAEISYQKKLQAAEVIGEERVRVLDPDFGSLDAKVDFESFQVPLYRSPEGGEVDPEAVGLDPLRREQLMREASEEAGEDVTVETPADAGADE